MAGANSRFKVDNGLVASGNAIFYDRVDVAANAYFNNDLFVVSGNLVVNGTLVYANVTVGQGGVLLVADQQPLGNTSNRFNAFLYDTISYGTIRPNSNGGALGTTNARFEMYANTVTVSQSINFPGGVSINSTSYTGTINNASTVGGLSSNGIIVKTGASSAVSRTITGSNSVSVTNGNGVSGNPTVDLALGYVGSAINSALFANSSGLYINVSATSDGTLPISRGGTGGPDRQTGINNLLPSQNSAVTDYTLRTDGTNVYWALATGPRGYTGSQGNLGYTGSAGTIGYTGSAGSTGATGYTGSAGSAGTNGYTGSQGVTGYTGSAGYWGSRGYTGSAGADGSTGYTGSQGGVGYTGSAGTNGSVGYTGSAGITGYTGSAGAQGGVGYTGSVGYWGSVGSTGYTGSAGTNGYWGSVGYTGSASTVIGYTGSATPGTLYNVTTGYTSGGKMFISNTTPTATAAGDLWIDTSGTSGYSQSLASSGYTKLPNGLVIQWGTVSSTYYQGSASLTFPTAFSTSCYMVVATGINTNGGTGTTDDIFVQITSWTTTGATLTIQDVANVSSFIDGYNWIAIGV